MLTINHSAVIIDGRIIDLDALDIEVIAVFGIQHATSNIWNILTSVTLSQYVDLVSLHGECIDEVLPEAHELLCDIGLVCDIFCPPTEARGDRLVNPNHVGEIRPRVWVLNRLKGS